MKPQGLIEVVGDTSRNPSRLKLKRPGMDRTIQVRFSRSRSLEADDIAVVRGLPVTTAARTLLDLAAVLSGDRLRTAFNEADRLGLLKKEQLIEIAGRPGGRRGMGHFRRLVVARHPDIKKTKSELEVMFLDLCRRAGLPRPGVNQIVSGFEVDCSWPHERLVVELDSFEFHGSRMGFVNDVKRTNRLNRAGFRTIRISYDEICFEPDEVVLLMKRELNRK